MRAAISVIVIVVAFATRAWAGPSAADVAFEKGRTLSGAKKWAEAKVAFEESQRLEPKNGTRFNIAQCDEHLGKLASALAVYKDLAENDTRTDRKALVADLVKQVEARVPKLQIKLDPPAAGATITLNDAPITPAASGVPVDFGEYTIGVTAPGHEPGSATAVVNEEGRTIVVTVRMVPKQAVAVAASSPGMPGRKKAAIVMWGLGAAALVGGGLAGLSASGTWDEALAICGSLSTCATEDDADRANELGADARSAGNVSTVLVVAGVAMVTTGIILWVTAPKSGSRSERAVAIGAAPTADGFAVAIGGRF